MFFQLYSYFHFRPFHPTGTVSVPVAITLRLFYLISCLITRCLNWVSEGMRRAILTKIAGMLLFILSQ